MNSTEDQNTPSPPVHLPSHTSAPQGGPRVPGPKADLWRAWWALVVLSLRRQARARQMVWIALGLLVIAGAWVGIRSARGQWGMHEWRSPRRNGPTYTQWLLKAWNVPGVLHRSPAAVGIDHAFLASVGVILSPDTTDDEGRRLGISAFQVFSQTVVFSIFLTFLLPLWSLSFATESIGGERESQSLIWLLSRPIPRWAIYAARFVALLPWSVGLNVGGFALLCLAGGPPGRLALQLFWPAVVWATLAFSALFLLFGAYFRRPAVVAVVYSFCLEVVLGNMPGYVKRLSVGYYARCLMYEKAGGYGIQPDNPGVFLPVDGATAAAVLSGGALALLGLGMWIFSRTEYQADSEG